MKNGLGHEYVHTSSNVETQFDIIFANPSFQFGFGFTFFDISVITFDAFCLRQLRGHYKKRVNQMQNILNYWSIWLDLVFYHVLTCAKQYNVDRPRLHLLKKVPFMRIDFEDRFHTKVSNFKSLISSYFGYYS